MLLKINTKTVALLFITSQRFLHLLGIYIKPYLKIHALINYLITIN
ncbi:MAG: hypothetical protein ACI9Q4_000801 [Sediminicola sp.]|jgi:hypothetical protein